MTAKIEWKVIWNFLENYISVYREFLQIFLYFLSFYIQISPYILWKLLYSFFSLFILSIAKKFSRLSHYLFFGHSLFLIILSHFLKYSHDSLFPKFRFKTLSFKGSSQEPHKSSKSNIWKISPIVSLLKPIASFYKINFVSIYLINLIIRKFDFQKGRTIFFCSV